MKIILVGATGTMERHLTAAFEKEHQLVPISTHAGPIPTDITSPEAIERMYEAVGAFDALVCTAGPTYVGPWGNYHCWMITPICPSTSANSLAPQGRSVT